MARNNQTQIGGELKSVAADGVVAGAEAIFDYTQGKSQETINAELIAGGGTQVDSEMSTTSENPLQNKVVTNALNGTVKNKGSNGNVRVGVGDYSNIDITSSSIGMETGNGAILIGNDITLNTSGEVKYNGSKVATAADLQYKEDVIQDLSTIRSGASAGATAYQKPQAGIPKTDLASAVQTSLGKADTAVQPAALQSGLAGKQDTVSDLATIRSGASAGATAYQKPSGGIPKTDLASAVQTSLGKADTALQAHQDISGKADVAALAGYTPTANFATINGASITGGGNVIITAGSSSITTIDATPTSGSTNPVQSGGVYDAIEGGFYY